MSREIKMIRNFNIVTENSLSSKYIKTDIGANYIKNGLLTETWSNDVQSKGRY